MSITAKGGIRFLLRELTKLTCVVKASEPHHAVVPQLSYIETNGKYFISGLLREETNVRVV